MMRDSVRPMLRLAIFGTYTLVAIGIDAVRGRLRDARMPAEQKRWHRTRGAVPAPGRRRRSD